MDGMEASGGRSASMKKLCGGSLLQEKVGVASGTTQFLVFFPCRFCTKEYNSRISEQFSWLILVIVKWSMWTIPRFQKDRKVVDGWTSAQLSCTWNSRVTWSSWVRTCRNFDSTIVCKMPWRSWTADTMTWALKCTNSISERRHLYRTGQLFQCSWCHQPEKTITYWSCFHKPWQAGVQYLHSWSPLSLFSQFRLCEISETCFNHSFNTSQLLLVLYSLHISHWQ